MDMTEKREKAGKAEQGSVSTIGAGVVITGEVECSTDLQIEGRVNGDVRCPTLLLSEGGLVSGSIHAERVRISGRVEGSVDAGDLAIEATAHIKGDVLYGRLKVTPGGIVQGNFQNRGDEEAREEPSGLKLVEPVTPEPEPAPQPRYVFGE